jgi:hypothetical protein
MPMVVALLRPGRPPSGMPLAATTAVLRTALCCQAAKGAVNAAKYRTAFCALHTHHHAVQYA